MIEEAAEEGARCGAKLRDVMVLQPFSHGIQEKRRRQAGTLLIQQSISCRSACVFIHLKINLLNTGGRVHINQHHITL